MDKKIGFCSIVDEKTGSMVMEKVFYWESSNSKLYEYENFNGSSEIIHKGCLTKNCLNKNHLYTDFKMACFYYCRERYGIDRRNKEFVKYINNLDDNINKEILDEYCVNYLVSKK